MDNQDIKSLSLTELKEVVASYGEKAFRAKQLYEWIHKKLAASYDEMTNIPKKLREDLSRDWPYLSLEAVEVQTSKLDGTQKYLFLLPDGNVIESVLMKYRKND